MPDHHHPADERPAQPDYTRMRRVVIEERQEKTLEHLRASTGYADDVSPHSHNALPDVASHQGRPRHPVRLRRRRRADRLRRRRRPPARRQLRRVLAAYGGVFIVGSLVWGVIFDGNPDRYDIAGAVICLVGVALIMYAPR